MNETRQSCLVLKSGESGEQNKTKILDSQKVGFFYRRNLLVICMKSRYLEKEKNRQIKEEVFE